ncbi:hypothetical protein APSETT444_004682 [Aspergillus pseudonomiae]
MDDQYIAHQLLVELLAVDTQEHLLGRQNAVQRYVELGPSNILMGMAQKAVRGMVIQGKRLVASSIQLLASSLDAKKLCYEYDERKAPSVPQITLDVPTPELPRLANPPSIPQKPKVTPARAPKIVIDDVALSRVQIVQALVARKLKTPIAQLPTSKSIKELSGGRSSLQNELVGDLHNEFSSIPDAPEQILLRDFGDASPTVQLGKTSSAAVAKLISSKMPSDFNANAIRTHLAGKWGLGPLRQTAVLLYAIASEPPLRLTSSSAAEEFWDKISSMYAESCDITLRPRQDTMNEDAVASSAVDPEVVAEFSKAHRRLGVQQFQALAEYLQIDLSGSQASQSDALVAECQQKVDLWTAEMTPEFLAGITPMLDVKKSRRYGSWWNMARQDVLAFYRRPSYSEFVDDALGFKVFLNRLRTRADEALLNMVRSLSCDAYFKQGSLPGYHAASQLLEQAITSTVADCPKARLILPAVGPHTTITRDGKIEYTEAPRPGVSGPTAYIQSLRQDTSFISLKSADVDTQINLTDALIEAMCLALHDGISFVGKTFLVTGAGQGSIGAGVVRLLLEGGARVLVTTSRELATTARYFQQMYNNHGAKFSELRVIPCNLASAQDCKGLIQYVYDPRRLNWDLDAILPFAAASDYSTEMHDIGGQSELGHRLMLVNVFRLLGHIVHCKRNAGVDCHPTQVLLPLSPNHGIFGGDGMYPESKLALESLFHRIQSESWSDQLSICGVRIGWTRSTGLMTTHDIIADKVEQHGIRTFSVAEMAFNIAMLLTPKFVAHCEDGPLDADFTGRLGTFGSRPGFLAELHQNVQLAAEVIRAVQAEDEHERLLSPGTKPTQQAPVAPIHPRSSLCVGYPHLPDYEREIRPLLPRLEGLQDPANAVVVVGYSELGPWGSARLRWEMESQGQWTSAGYVELAWLMNLIRHVDDESYVGWVDTQTGKPVRDGEIQALYGDHIDNHTGIRPIQSTSYNPERREVLQEVAVEEDLPEFEVSQHTADAMRLRHGAHVSIRPSGNPDACRVKLKRGAVILVPKTVPFVWGSCAGELPAGWTPAKYGIPENLIHQVDPVTLYTVCCVAEAFYSAGITDPLEVFQHIHLSELGNFIGSSMGGPTKTRQLYRDVYFDYDIPSDVLQDTYLNTPAAWVNMLLLGCTGPIKTPVGACATGVESIDSGYESIMAGKTKMCLVGGYDDLQEEASYGFAQLKATVNVEEEIACGRQPSEMSRPMAESRAGFVEAHGCGIQLLCRGDIALKMGLPIYAVIASSAMAADKIGSSVPAPGQGILSFSRERARSSMISLTSRPSSRSSISSEVSDKSFLTSITSISNPAPRIQRARPTTDMAPLRAALATWGLTIDDLDVASLHGTSTRGNDLNEPEVIETQMRHLGRTPGRPLWAICQKSVTGHPKAPAAAWMLNGCLQVLDSGLVPGNRNLDTLDEALRNASHLCFPTRTVQLREVKAFLLTSFGFGQKGGQIVGVAPKYFFATLLRPEVEDYYRKVRVRTEVGNRAYAAAIMSQAVVKIQTQNPYDEYDAARIFLDPLARISQDPSTGEYRFHPDAIPALDNDTLPSPGEPAELVKGISSAWIEEQVRPHISPGGTVGVDLVPLASFDAYENATFVERNYTAREREWAEKSADVRAAYASRWCAKEAVFKCLQTHSQGAGAAMKEIEIEHSANGAPKVKLRGAAQTAARQRGLEGVQLSISYGDDAVIAVALGLMAGASY